MKENGSKWRRDAKLLQRLLKFKLKKINSLLHVAQLNIILEMCNRCKQN